jgi:hypothetical protein
VPAPGEFEWVPGRVRYGDLPQVRDEYVVHARGFVLDETVLVDPYAVAGGHASSWEAVFADRYGGADWRDAADRYLYWSVTGSGTFFLQHPRRDELSEETVEYLRSFLYAVGVDPDASVAFVDDDLDTRRVDAAEFVGRDPDGG